MVTSSTNDVKSMKNLGIFDNPDRVSYYQEAGIDYHRKQRTKCLLKRRLKVER